MTARMNIGPSNSRAGSVPSRLRRRIERHPTRAERADFGGPQWGGQSHEPLEHEAILREKGACGVAEHDERAGDGGLRARRYERVEGSADCRSSVDRIVDDRDSLALNSPLTKCVFQVAVGAIPMVTTSVTYSSSMTAIMPKTTRESVRKTKMKAARASAASLGVP